MEINHTKDIAQTFTGFLTPLIAILTVYIAWQQYQINNSSLKNQLYERRLKVFQSCMSYLGDISRNSTTTYERATQFQIEVSEADFLFSDKIVKKLEELYKKGIKLASYRKRLYPDSGQGLPRGEQRSKVVQEEAGLGEWFDKELTRTKDLFKQEMRLTSNKK